MLIIWGITAVSNAVLCLTLLFRGYYIRYSWLFASTIFSIFADAIGVHAWYNHAFIYPALWRTIYFLCIGINLFIIWEAFCLKDRRVQFPMELYLILELASFLTEKAGFLTASYDMMCALRVINLILNFYFIVIFSQEPIYDRS